MMLPDSKKSASVIVAKIKPGKSEEIKEEVVSNKPQSDYSLALEDAAKKMIEAVSKKDAKMLVSHLKDFMDMCDEQEDLSEVED